MQMKNCDVIGQVTALDPSDRSTQLTRNAPGDNITPKQCLGAIIGDDGFTIKCVIYANLCK